jgi:hypothetical protein
MYLAPGRRDPAADADSPAARWRDDHDAAWLDPIADTPQARWLTGPTTWPTSGRCSTCGP